MALGKIVSGGQTGVDRGALEAAIAHSLPHGGWCPRDRLAEDGRVPERFQLTETPSRRYAERTERNVLDSDGTLILCRGTLGGGTRLTERLAVRHRKPLLVLDLDLEPAASYVVGWLASHSIHVLNVAGPRESTCPGIEAQAKALFSQVLSLIAALSGRSERS